jgi:hypothetical protein
MPVSAPLFDSNDLTKHDRRSFMCQSDELQQQASPAKIWSHVFGARTGLAYLHSLVYVSTLAQCSLCITWSRETYDRVLLGGEVNALCATIVRSEIKCR